MDSERWEHIKTLFFAALDRDADERSAFMDAVTTDDPALRSDIEDLLAVHERGQALLLENRLLVDEAEARPAPDALLGTHIGPYRLMKLIGQGGMGAVYLAERDGDFEQQVALKLIRPGLHTAEVVVRFRVERQILARLQHPNIARLLDGGTTEDGQPYLVMEYVTGTPITAFCDAHRLSIPARVHLFQRVCQTVQFAHRNLVVHRDLKPSNILVTEEGQVKLLDFGIAKLLDPHASGPHVLTRAQMQVLTPEYAAPEQIRGEAITTSADVYALGVLLYELLTGHRPYHLPERRQAEIERIICEEEPTRPSTIVAEVEEVDGADGTTETLTPERVSAARATQAARLRRTLQGDIDNIVMMALRKESERRYTSAEQIADDLKRYLDGRPVLARKDTLAYRTGKFVRRNRIGVGVAALFLLLLLGFSAVTARQAQRLAQERDKAEQVATFLSGIFAAADPATAQGDTLTALALLERGAARIETELAGRPTVQADLLDVMSTAYLGQGAYDRAEGLARRALALRAEADLGAASSSSIRLAEALAAQSRFAEADTLYRSVVAHHRTHGDTPALIEALEQRGAFLIASLSTPDTVKAVFEEALALRRSQYGSDDPGRGRTLLQYARAYHVGGDYHQAEQLFREALHEQRRFAGDPVTTAETLLQLGIISSFRRQYLEADTLLQEALLLRRQVYGEKHPKTAEGQGYLAHNHIALQQFTAAEDLLRNALETYKAFNGRESQEYVSMLRAQRQLLAEAGRYEEAIAVSDEVVALTERVYGADSRSLATNLSHHAQVVLYAGYPAEALAVFRRALPLVAATLGQDAPFYALMLAEQARASDAVGQPAEADVFYTQAYAIMKKKLGLDSYERSRTAFELGLRHAARGDHAEAVVFFEDAVTVRGADSEKAAKMVARAHHAFGRSLLALARPADAEPHLHLAYEQLHDLLGDEHAETRAAQQALLSAQQSDTATY